LTAARRFDVREETLLSLPDDLVRGGRLLLATRDVFDTRSDVVFAAGLFDALYR
jgi:hypothetical protein